MKRRRVKIVCLWRPLARRHNQLLQLSGDGLTDRDAAQRMGITLGTVRNYIAQLRVVLHVQTLEDVRRLAREWSAKKLRIYAEIKREKL
jgi:DNA-binding NarL/FixJ family response regulator